MGWVRAVSCFIGQKNAPPSQGTGLTYYSQASCIGDGGGEFSVADPGEVLGRFESIWKGCEPLHPSLDYWDWCIVSGEYRSRTDMAGVLLMPSCLVRAVLNGMMTSRPGWL